MGSEQGRSRNQYLRKGTVPDTCPSPTCGVGLQREDATDTTTGGIAFRLKCPDCGVLFDQACPDCGSKDIQMVDGVEECLHCGMILQLGATPIGKRTQQ